MKKILTVIIIFTLLLTAAGCERGIPENGVHSAADVSGRTVGVLSGSAAESLVENAGTLIAYTTAEELAADLRYGKLDCVVTDTELAPSVLGAQGRIKKLAEPYLEQNWRFAIAKENADLTEDVNSALASLAEAGTLRAISEGYLLGGDYRYASPENADRSAGGIVMAADSSFAPYAYINDEGDWAGIDVDVARAVCDILGVELSIVNTKRAELVDSVWYGKVQFAMGGIAESKETLEKIDLSDPYTTSRQELIVRKKGG